MQMPDWRSLARRSATRALAPGHSHPAFHGLVVVIAVDVAAKRDGVTEFSIFENSVTDANLHACGAPAAGMADRSSHSKLTSGERGRKGF